MRHFGAIAIVLSALAGTVLGGAPERWQIEKFEDLKLEYRQVSQRHRSESSRRDDRVRILRAVIELEYDDAMRWAVNTVRDCGDPDLQREMLKRLERTHAKSAIVIGMFRDIATVAGPNRTRARDFLLEWAVRENQQPWLLRLFQTGDFEDKFLSVEAMGQVASGTTLEYARRLLDDTAWTPVERGVVRCGTLARALRAFEGEAAARFLLLLQQDPRFGEEDAEAVRHATRLWKFADLKRYVSLRALGESDPARRAGVARFMGRAGIEAARAPLSALARDRNEDTDVRVAAAEALGGLRLARGALVRELKPLLRDDDDAVRQAAIRALANLRVRDAVVALAPVLDGPGASFARTALSRALGRPADTDWLAWVAAEDCPIPEGT